MNAGQIMMQTPVNATLSVAVPANPAMVTLPAGDQQATDFAGVLAGIAPQGPSQPLEVAIPVGGGTSASKGIALDPLVQDAKVAIVAALRATTAKAAQTEPSEAEDQAEPVEEKVTEDVVMPQNVVLCASGALIAAEQQINGRMPLQDTMDSKPGSDQDGRAMMVNSAEAPELAYGAVKAASAPVEAVLNKAAVSLPEGAVAGPATEAVIVPKTDLQRTLVQGAEVPAVAMTMPGHTNQTGIEAIPEHRDLPQAVIPKHVAEKQPLESDVQPQPVRLPDLSATMAGMPANPAGPPAGTEQVVTVAGVTATTTTETVVEGIAVESHQAASTPVPESGSPERQPVPADGQAAMLAVMDGPVASRSNTIQQRIAPKTEVKESQPLQVPVAGPRVPAAEETPAHTMQSVQDQAAARPAEFRFSRSAAVEAALGNNNQATGPRSMDKTAPVHESGLKTVVEQQLPDGADGGFSGSDAGSTGKALEGFVQQAPLQVRPMSQNIPGAHQPFSVDAASTTQPQALQAESSRPGSSEHIAGQVRSQLGTHEIKTGSEQITIRLSPEHLGDIKVNFKLEDQRLKVEIVTENRFAKESLLQHADLLKDSLARQNISMDRFEVTTGGGSGNQWNNSQGEWRELAKNRQSQQWMASGGYRTQADDEVQKAPAYTRPEHAVLDLHF